MSQCGGLEYISGGVINGASVINSQITSSDITSSTFTSGSIVNLAQIDESSAKTVADALAGLSADQLKALAAALFAAMPMTSAVAPVSSESGVIPTTIYGGRTAIMGEPDMVIAAPDPNFVIPVYRV